MQLRLAGAVLAALCLPAQAQFAPRYIPPHPPASDAKVYALIPCGWGYQDSQCRYDPGDTKTIEGCEAAVAKLGLAGKCVEAR